MPYDRPRRAGENILDYGVATQRIAASGRQGWQTMLAGGLPESFIENLATPLLKPEGNDAGRSPLPTSTTLTAKVRQRLGLSATAGAADIFAAIDRLGAPVAASRRPAAVTLAASPAPAQPLVNSALNPAVYELATSSPQAYRDALQASGGTVPGLFGPGRDLPEVTASGIDPSKLAAVPWHARPAIAAAADATEAQGLLALASGPDADALVGTLPEFAGHPGVRDYLAEVRAFSEAGTAVMRRRLEDQQIAELRTQRDQVAAAVGTSPTAEADYQVVFGGMDAHRQRLAELRGRNHR